MKNLSYLSAALLLLMVIAEGCQKTKFGEVLYQGQLIATKTTVKLYEPDTLILIGAQNDSVKFSVTPADGDTNSNFTLYKSANNKANIAFAKAGTYTVRASKNGGTPATKVITVLNENFYPPVNTNPPPPTQDTTITIQFTGDLIITPTYFKVPDTDSTGFALTVQTSKTYPCGNSFLNIRRYQTNDSYTLDALNIIQPPATQCALANTQLKENINFRPLVNSSIVPDHSYPLNIIVGGTTYTGSITFNQTYMDITWNYTSGVILSSKHVTLTN